jgi:chromosomal replication initiator protein
MGALSEQVSEALKVSRGPTTLAQMHAEHKARRARMMAAPLKERRLLPRDINAELAELTRREAEAEAKLREILAESKRKHIELLEAQARVAISRAQGRTRMEAIIRMTAARFGYSYLELISPRRKQPLVQARQAAMWLVWKTTDRSHPEIGRAMGGRDHTTILHGVRKVEERMAAQPEYADLVRGLRDEIEEAKAAAMSAALDPTPLSATAAADEIGPVGL